MREREDDLLVTGLFPLGHRHITDNKAGNLSPEYTQNSVTSAQARSTDDR